MSKAKGEQLIKELARKPSNKTCFDCGRIGPHGKIYRIYHCIFCFVLSNCIKRRKLLAMIDLIGIEPNPGESKTNNNNNNRLNAWTNNKQPCPHCITCNVNLSINTFVCTTCAGLLRTLNHKVKTISASNFTDNEVSALENGGNKKARKLWFGKWNEGAYKLDPEDNKNVETFMRLTYERKQWYDPNGATDKPSKLEKQKTLKKGKDSVTMPASAPATSATSPPPNNNTVETPKPKSITKPEAPKQSQPAPSNQSAQSKPAESSFDFLTNIGALTFEEPKPTTVPATSNGNNSNGFSNGNGASFAAFSNSPFPSQPNSRRGSFNSPNPNGNNTHVPSAAVAYIVTQLKTAYNNFNLDLTSLQQATVQALNEIKSEFKNPPPQVNRQPSLNSILNAPNNNSNTQSNNNNTNATAAATTSPPKGSLDIFADIQLPSDSGNRYQNGNGTTDEDDGNPFGDDSDNEEDVGPHKSMHHHTQQQQQVHKPINNPNTHNPFQPQPQPSYYAQPAAAVYNQFGQLTSPISPQPGAISPQPPVNAAAGYYPAQTQVYTTVPVPVMQPVAVSPQIAAQYAAQHAAQQQLYHHHSIMAAQQQARAEVAAEKVQQQRSQMDQNLFSGLNPLG